MRRYAVHFHAVVGRSVEVEAEDREAAIEAAWGKFEDEAPGGLCHQCSREVGDLSDWDLQDDKWAVDEIKDPS